ncbi:MAG: hypothetical protein HYZ09_01355 [Candidatus Kerfeldbacteria bacterium]|nr:hypothetical protein [Candidatus Kerfeldbacteria bacterium]
MLTIKRLSLITTTLFVALIAPTVASAAVTIPNPIACPDLLCLFKGIVRIFLGVLAVFATFVFIYGGFLMLSSAGNPDRIKKAKDTLFWATMGIVTVLGSWAFIRFVLESTSRATGL